MNRRTFFGAIAGAGVAAMVPAAKAGPMLKAGDRIGFSYSGVDLADGEAFTSVYVYSFDGKFIGMISERRATQARERWLSGDPCKSVVEYL